MAMHFDIIVKLSNRRVQNPIPRLVFIPYLEQVLDVYHVYSLKLVSICTILYMYGVTLIGG